MKNKYIILIARFVFCIIMFPAVLSLSYGETCEVRGWTSGSSPKGPDYVALNASVTYTHTGDLSYRGERADFYNSENWYLGYDEYNTQDIIFAVARFHMTFNSFSSRGAAWVAMNEPKLNIIFCKNVIVQNLPSLSVKSFDAVNRSATVNYNIDEFSKVGRSGGPIVINFTWTSDFWGTSGSAGTVTVSALSGDVSHTFSLGSGADVYTISAIVSDGTYTTPTLILGDTIVTGTPTPPCLRCNKN